MLLDTVDCVLGLGLVMVYYHWQAIVPGGILAEKTKTCALMPRNCHGHLDKSVIN
jgi:hypothetical protein